MHNHMEALPIELVKRLAQKYNMELPADIFTPDGKRYNWTSSDNNETRFNEFILRYNQGASVIRELDDVKEIAYEFVKDGFIKSQCIYTEITVSTIHLCQATGKSYSEVIEAVVAGIKKAESEFDTHARISVVLVRHEEGFTADGLNHAKPVAICNAVVEDVINNQHDYVRGIVLAGAEFGFPPELFKDAFARARAAGLRVNPHAGELTNAQDVLDAITHLSPHRIGHGIRASERIEAMEELKEQDIPLEICPTSNIMLGNTTADLPHLRELHKQGVKFVIGTDDAPHFDNTTIRREYNMVAEALDLTPLEQLEITRHAITVSFAEEELKTKLHQKLDDFEVELRAALGQSISLH